MKLLCALALALVACGGPKTKTESPLVNEGSAKPENCCCKSNPLTSEDGKPFYEDTNRMECSTKPGECVDGVQCDASKGNPKAPSSESSPSPLSPSVSDLP